MKPTRSATAPALIFRRLIIALVSLPAPIDADAIELPLKRIAHGGFSEKIAVIWIGAEQGIFRKHGVNVEVIAIRTWPETMAALASGNIQIAYTIPGSVVGAAASGMDGADQAPSQRLENSAFCCDLVAQVKK